MSVQETRPPHNSPNDGPVTRPGVEQQTATQSEQEETYLSPVPPQEASPRLLGDVTFRRPAYPALGEQSPLGNPLGPRIAMCSSSQPSDMDEARNVAPRIGTSTTTAGIGDTNNISFSAPQDAYTHHISIFQQPIESSPASRPAPAEASFEFEGRPNINGNATLLHNLATFQDPTLGAYHSHNQPPMPPLSLGATNCKPPTYPVAAQDNAHSDADEPEEERLSYRERVTLAQRQLGVLPAQPPVFDPQIRWDRKATYAKQPFLQCYVDNSVEQEYVRHLHRCLWKQRLVTMVISGGAALHVTIAQTVTTLDKVLMGIATFVLGLLIVVFGMLVCLERGKQFRLNNTDTTSARATELITVVGIWVALVAAYYVTFMEIDFCETRGAGAAWLVTSEEEFIKEVCKQALPIRSLVCCFLLLLSQSRFFVSLLATAAAWVLFALSDLRYDTGEAKTIIIYSSYVCTAIFFLVACYYLELQQRLEFEAYVFSSERFYAFRREQSRLNRQVERLTTVAIRRRILNAKPQNDELSALTNNPHCLSTFATCVIIDVANSKHIFQDADETRVSEEIGSQDLVSGDLIASNIDFTFSDPTLPPSYHIRRSRSNTIFSSNGGGAHTHNAAPLPPPSAAGIVALMRLNVALTALSEEYGCEKIAFSGDSFIATSHHLDASVRDHPIRGCRMAFAAVQREFCTPILAGLGMADFLEDASKSVVARTSTTINPGASTSMTFRASMGDDSRHHHTTAGHQEAYTRTPSTSKGAGVGKRSKIDFQLRAGVHSGTIMGSPVGYSRVQYTICGDGVELAKKCLRLAPSSQALVTLETRHLVGDTMLTETVASKAGNHVEIMRPAQASLPPVAVSTPYQMAAASVSNTHNDVNNATLGSSLMLGLSVGQSSSHVALPVISPTATHPHHQAASSSLFPLPYTTSSLFPFLSGNAGLAPSTRVVRIVGFSDRSLSTQPVTTKPPFTETALFESVPLIPVPFEEAKEEEPDSPLVSGLIGYPLTEAMASLDNNSNTAMQSQSKQQSLAANPSTSSGLPQSPLRRGNSYTSGGTLAGGADYSGGRPLLLRLGTPGGSEGECSPNKHDEDELNSNAGFGHTAVHGSLSKLHLPAAATPNSTSIGRGMVPQHDKPVAASASSPVDERGGLVTNVANLLGGNFGPDALHVVRHQARSQIAHHEKRLGTSPKSRAHNRSKKKNKSPKKNKSSNSATPSKTTQQLGDSKLESRRAVRTPSPIAWRISSSGEVDGEHQPEGASTTIINPLLPQAAASTLYGGGCHPSGGVGVSPIPLGQQRGGILVNSNSGALKKESTTAVCNVENTEGNNNDSPIFVLPSSSPREGKGQLLSAEAPNSQLGRRRTAAASAVAAAPSDMSDEEERSPNASEFQDSSSSSYIGSGGVRSVSQWLTNNKSHHRHTKSSSGAAHNTSFAELLARVRNSVDHLFQTYEDLSVVPACSIPVIAFAIPVYDNHFRLRKFHWHGFLLLWFNMGFLIVNVLQGAYILSIVYGADTDPDMSSALVTGLFIATLLSRIFALTLLVMVHKLKWHSESIVTLYVVGGAIAVANVMFCILAVVAYKQRSSADPLNAFIFVVAISIYGPWRNLGGFIQLVACFLCCVGGCVLTDIPIQHNTFFLALATVLGYPFMFYLHDTSNRKLYRAVMVADVTTGVIKQQQALETHIIEAFAPVTIRKVFGFNGGKAGGGDDDNEGAARCPYEISSSGVKLVALHLAKKSLGQLGPARQHGGGAAPQSRQGLYAVNVNSVVICLQFDSLYKDAQQRAMDAWQKRQQDLLTQQIRAIDNKLKAPVVSPDAKLTVFNNHSAVAPGKSHHDRPSSSSSAQLASGRSEGSFGATASNLAHQGKATLLNPNDASQSQMSTSFMAGENVEGGTTMSVEALTNAFWIEAVNRLMGLVDESLVYAVQTWNTFVARSEEDIMTPTKDLLERSPLTVAWVEGNTVMLAGPFHPSPQPPAPEENDAALLTTTTTPSASHAQPPVESGAESSERKEHQAVCVSGAGEENGEKGWATIRKSFRQYNAPDETIEAASASYRHMYDEDRVRFLIEMHLLQSGEAVRTQFGELCRAQGVPLNGLPPTSHQRQSASSSSRDGEEDTSGSAAEESELCRSTPTTGESPTQELVEGGLFMGPSALFDPTSAFALAQPSPPPPRMVHLLPVDAHLKSPPTTTISTNNSPANTAPTAAGTPPFCRSNVSHSATVVALLFLSHLNRKLGRRSRVGSTFAKKGARAQPSRRDSNIPRSTLTAAVTAGTVFSSVSSAPREGDVVDSCNVFGDPLLAARQLVLAAPASCVVMCTSVAPAAKWMLSRVALLSVKDTREAMGLVTSGSLQSDTPRTAEARRRLQYSVDRMSDLNGKVSLGDVSHTWRVRGRVFTVRTVVFKEQQTQLGSHKANLAGRSFSPIGSELEGSSLQQRSARLLSNSSVDM